MKVERFLRIVQAFSDNPGDYDLRNGCLTVQVRDEVIEATLSRNADHELMVMEHGERLTARSWIEKRLARLPLLADRIRDHDESPLHFVAPSGKLLCRRIDLGISESIEKNITTVMAETLAKRTPGTSSVWFLTSNSGEGKTSVIHHLAVQQALKYKKRQAHWLLVPIPLGGRTFLRFDDVVISALANRLRFQFLYYDAFLELVRLGLIVPAFDGFEEMITEGSTDEAVSALSDLVKDLGSTSTILIATRKAYYEYKSFQSMARLLDPITNVDVAFGSMSLERWNRDQFIEYGRKRGLRQVDELFSRVAGTLGVDHPLLTRAVIVKRLFDVVDYDESALPDLVEKIKLHPQDYFSEFITAIIERETREKWLDKSGKSARNVLTIEEHHVLLSKVAHEMWLQLRDDLRIDDIGVVSELFTEDGGKSLAVARQIQELLKQHALLVKTRDGKRLGFDHEDFREFYLGLALGRELVNSDAGNVRAILDMTTLPQVAVEKAKNYVHSNGNPYSTIRLLQDLVSCEPSVSFVRENCGFLTVMLVDSLDECRVTVSKMSFPADSLRGRSLQGLTVSDSHFSTTSLEGAKLVDCRFERCRLERLEGIPSKIENTRLYECDVASLVYPDDEYDDIELYNPRQIQRRLSQTGFQLEYDSTVELRVIDSTDSMSADLKLVQRVLRIFSQTTRISEFAIQRRLGKYFGRFERVILPRLTSARVLEELQAEGGHQRRFKIAVSMREIEEAMTESDGDFGRFVEAIGN